jgi:hypothetical protein
MRVARIEGLFSQQFPIGFENGTIALLNINGLLSKCPASGKIFFYSAILSYR